MLYGALELTAKILGICKEYEAQEIVQEIANSLTMPIDGSGLQQPRSSNAPGLSAAALTPGRPRQDPMTSFCSGTPVYSNT